MKFEIIQSSIEDDRLHVRVRSKGGKAETLDIVLPYSPTSDAHDLRQRVIEKIREERTRKKRKTVDLGGDFEIDSAE